LKTTFKGGCGIPEEVVGVTSEKKKKIDPRIVTRGTRRTKDEKRQSPWGGTGGNVGTAAAQVKGTREEGQLGIGLGGPSGTKPVCPGKGKENPRGATQKKKIKTGKLLNTCDRGVSIGPSEIKKKKAYEKKWPWR